MSLVEIMVETPGGFALKYNYDFESGLLKVKKKLPSGMVFPFDFGCIPGTKGEDGDPLDVLLISECNCLPGCKVDCRIIGSIQALQTEKEASGTEIRNDRLLAIPEYSLQFKDVMEMQDLAEPLLSEIESFFRTYNEIEGKIFVVTGRLNATAALEFIEKSKERPNSRKQ